MFFLKIEVYNFYFAYIDFLYVKSKYINKFLCCIYSILNIEEHYFLHKLIFRMKHKKLYILKIQETF